MRLGIYTGSREGDAEWVAALKGLMPDLELRAFPDWGPGHEIDYAFVWQAPADLLQQCVNLKAIISLGAGVEHLTDIQSALPEGVAIVRMADPALVECMTEYVLMNVLIHHRSVLDYQEIQRQSLWQQLPASLARRRRVGFMGLGNMARPAAILLADMGFDVAAWTRSGHHQNGMESFAGTADLSAFLGRSDILVCLLPATPATEGLLDADTLALLPPGAAVINAGRGTLIVEDDLLAALDSGHLSGASLDVFVHEPLPPDSPLWTHPRVILTPHMASPSIVESAARYAAGVINQLRNGAVPEYIVDMIHGY